MCQKLASGAILPRSWIQKFSMTAVWRVRFIQKLLWEKHLIFTVCGSDPQYFDSVIIIFILISHLFLARYIVANNDNLIFMSSFVQ